MYLTQNIFGLSLFFVLNYGLFAADSAFEPTQPWPDRSGTPINAHGGGILYYNGSYYWFGEHKIAGRRGNTAQIGVHCYASKDLYHWSDEGIALSVSSDPNSEIVRGCIIERPKVIYNPKTKQFVMWFHLELKDQGYKAALAGLAVSDKATGPYTFLRSFRPNAGKMPINVKENDLEPSSKNYFLRDFADGQMARDMTLFVDDDGKAYHIAASEENRTLHISLLTDDFLNFSGTFSRVLIGMSREAPAVCKYKGRYYLLSSGCTGWAPNAASYAVADSVLGPYTPMGNPCVGKNSKNGMGSEQTFGAQSTYILSVQGKKDAYIAMFDVWKPQNPIDGTYIWLPVEFSESGHMAIRYRPHWDLSVFDR